MRIYSKERESSKIPYCLVCEDDGRFYVFESINENGFESIDEGGAWIVTMQGDGWNFWDDIKCPVCKANFRKTSPYDGCCKSCGSWNHVPKHY